MADADGRHRVIVDTTTAIKRRLDKLPQGTRKPLYNGLFKAMLNQYDEDGSSILYAIMDGRVKLVEIPKPPKKEITDGGH